MEKGQFRQDLYYRLCSDQIHMPALSEIFRDDPTQLEETVAFIAAKCAGEEEADRLTAEVIAVIDRELGRDYPWYGNYRELEQCVRNILIRRDYQPRTTLQTMNQSVAQTLADDVVAGRLQVDELIRRYCTLIYAETGSYEQTARRLGLDRRTVKSRIDPDLLDTIRQSP